MKCKLCNAEFIGEGTFCEKCTQSILNQAKESVDSKENVKLKKPIKKKIIVIASLSIIAVAIGIFLSVSYYRVCDFFKQIPNVEIVTQQDESGIVENSVSTSFFENNQKTSDNTWLRVNVKKKTQFYFCDACKIADHIYIISLSDFDFNPNDLYYIKFNEAKKINGSWLVTYDKLCSNDDWNKVNTNIENNKITEKPKEPVVTAPKPATEKKLTVYDIYDKIKEEYADSPEAAVYLDTTEKKITILYCYEGAAALCQKSISYDLGSIDAYEIWLDMKSNFKSLSESYRDEYLERNGIYDYSVSCCLLNDEKHNSPNVSGEYSSILICTNGHCLFDGTDH